MTRKRSSTGCPLDLLVINVLLMAQGDLRVKKLQGLTNRLSPQAWRQKRNCCMKLLVWRPPRELPCSLFPPPPCLWSPQHLTHIPPLQP